MAVSANDNRILRMRGRAIGSQVSPAALAEAVTLGIIVVLALQVRLGPLERGLTFDELFTAVNFVGAESAWKTASTSINFNNHVGYSLLARLAVSLLGPTDVVLRLPALVFGLLTVPVAWWLTRPLLGPRLALAVTFALAMAPEQVRWSTSARGYSAMVLGVLLASGLLFRLLRHSERSTAALFGLVIALTAYFHLYAVSVVVVQVVLLALRWRFGHDGTARRGAGLGLLALTGAGLSIVLLYLPMLPSLLFSIQHAGRGEPWPTFPWVVATELLGGSRDWLVAAMLVVAGLGVARIGRVHPWLAGYGVAVAVVPLAIGTLTRPSDLYPRFFVFLAPFLLVALVVGAVALADLAGRLLPGVPRPLTWLPVMAGAAMLLGGWLDRYPELSSDEGFRDAAQALMAAPTENVTLCAAGAGAELFRWYVPRLATVPKTVAELQRATLGRTVAWCVYRPSSWESRTSGDIRRYLQERSTVEQFGDVLLFRERART